MLSLTCTYSNIEYTPTANPDSPFLIDSAALVCLPEASAIEIHVRSFGDSESWQA